MAGRDTSTLFLFDVDGTLTPSRLPISEEMENFMERVKEKVVVGVVGGSDLQKIDEQMAGNALKKFEYVFSENGLVYHKNGQLVAVQNIQGHIGEDKLQMFINYALGYMSTLVLPRKRGTFIEFRNGLINVCPVGRSCSQSEREEFAAYDEVHKVREQFVADLREKFPDIGLVYSIGGQISFDVFPEGWDKRFCLNHLEKENFKTIHFFGDKTAKGGNDHEIYNDPRVIGHTVKNPDDTRKQLEALLFHN